MVYQVREEFLVLMVPRETEETWAQLDLKVKGASLVKEVLWELLALPDPLVKQAVLEILVHLVPLEKWEQLE